MFLIFETAKRGRKAGCKGAKYVVSEGNNVKMYIDARIFLYGMLHYLSFAEIVFKSQSRRNTKNREKHFETEHVSAVDLKYRIETKKEIFDFAILTRDKKQPISQ